MNRVKNNVQMKYLGLAYNRIKPCFADLAPNTTPFYKVIPNDRNAYKDLEYLSNKARILETTKVAKLIVNFCHGIFKQTIW